MLTNASGPVFILFIKDPVGRFSHAQVDPNDPETRIRGGGDNDEKESLPDDSLVSLPVASWENQLVYMDSETTEFGESRGHHTFIGYVWKLPDELLAKTSKEIMDMEDVEIQVALIYSDQLGVFSGELQYNLVFLLGL